MKRLSTYSVFLLILCSSPVLSQDADSTLDNLLQIPAKYISDINKKADQYSSRITNKTSKTLTKLSRWENKIKGLLEKASPETAARLFGNGQLTFTNLLNNSKNGLPTVLEYQAQYNSYRDDITTNLNYLENEKSFLSTSTVQQLRVSSKKIKELNQIADSTDQIEQFIKERKKLLINTAYQHLGKSKYLSKINKEAWYYAETMKNYKEVFSDQEKLEQTVKKILNGISGFQKFVQKNSMLATIFGQNGTNTALSPLPNLQARYDVQNLITQQISVGGANSREVLSKNMQIAQAELSKLKNKISQPSFQTGEGAIPDFNPNTQKVKTFRQRLEFGSNVQFSGSSKILPSIMNVAVTAGFKLNDRFVVGLGIGYKMGLGSIEKIHFSNEGVNLRSFIDWKLKKQIFITGGWEIDNSPITATTVLQNKDENPWHTAALAGLSKKISLKSKWSKGTKLQILYNFCYRMNLPTAQPFLFRVGYEF